MNRKRKSTKYRAVYRINSWQFWHWTGYSECKLHEIGFYEMLWKNFVILSDIFTYTRTQRVRVWEWMGKNERIRASRHRRLTVEVSKWTIHLIKICRTYWKCMNSMNDNIEMDEMCVCVCSTNKNSNTSSIHNSSMERLKVLKRFFQSLSFFHSFSVCVRGFWGHIWFGHHFCLNGRNIAIYQTMFNLKLTIFWCIRIL